MTDIGPGAISAGAKITEWRGKGMNWKEALDAFEAQAPVMFTPGGSGPDVPCRYIYEVGIRREINGERVNVVYGMDQNKHAVYCGRPSAFRLINQKK